MATGAGLTICSVSFNSRPWLEVNCDLMLHLNPDAERPWLVVENSPVDSELSLRPDDTRFGVLPGARFEARVYASGSYHHGTGMNLVLPHVRTRYVLFCDPDFYIVRPRWAAEVVEHMAARALGVFGAPWHPHWVFKNRYFPCVHCMFVDLERVPVGWLDFRPDYEAVPGYARQGPRRKSHWWRLKVPDPLRMRKRRYLGRSHDVSWRIAARVAVEPAIRVECLQPVFRPRRQGLAYQFDRLLPDSLALIPKREGYYSERGFGDLALPDLDSRGWEEFMWRGTPFGFHVRAQPKLKAGKSLESDLAEVTEVLRAFPC